MLEIKGFTPDPIIPIYWIAFQIKKRGLLTSKPFTIGVDFYTLSLPKLLIYRELYIYHLPEYIFGRSTNYNPLKSKSFTDYFQVFSTPLVNGLFNVNPRFVFYRSSEGYFKMLQDIEI
jgi:hypothetical protein